MQVAVVAVGRPDRRVGPAIQEYEGRAARYWKLDVTEVRAVRASKNRPVEDVRRDEAERLLTGVPEGMEIVALTRAGKGWSSERLARYLNGLAVNAAAGAAFVIGGAYGLDPTLLDRARHSLSLSALTMPHDLARLVLAEQLYRAGTIVRGEPYHKG